MDQTRERTLSVTTYSAEGLHIPSVDDEFFPKPIWFGDVLNGYFAIDRLMFIRIIMTVVLVLFFGLAMRKPKLVPSGVQNVAEMCLDFVRVNIAEEILGKKDGNRFLPLLTTIFIGVFAMNLPSVIPGMNISPNARIGFPIVLAVLGYIAFVYAGIKASGGFFTFLKNSVVIPGLPFFLHFLVVPLEFFSTFILRPVTLSIRLMANMLSGHLIMVLIFAATNLFFWKMNAWTALSGLTLLAGVAFMLFELLVVVLQAYIFALLSASYIELSIHADEH